MTTFIGLAIADSMFPTGGIANRQPLTVPEAKALIETGVVSCCNPSHKLTLEALNAKFGILVPIPEKAPFVKLAPGDNVIVLSARFPRRLNEGETWSEDDVAKAEFVFGLWEVHSQEQEIIVQKVALAYLIEFAVTMGANLPTEIYEHLKSVVAKDEASQG